MKINVAYPATGCQKLFEINDEHKVRFSYILLAFHSYKIKQGLRLIIQILVMMIHSARFEVTKHMMVLVYVEENLFPISLI